MLTRKQITGYYLTNISNLFLGVDREFCAVTIRNMQELPFDMFFPEGFWIRGFEYSLGRIFRAGS